MADIVFGKYIEADSTLHGLNPLLKFILIITAIAGAGSAYGLFPLAAYFLIFLFATFSSGLSPLTYIRSLRPFRFIFAAVFIINYLAYTGNFEHAFIMTGRFFLIVLFSSVLTLTTKPEGIVSVVQLFISPLRIFRIDTSAFCSELYRSLSLVPVMIEEGAGIIGEKASKLQGTIEIIRRPEKLFRVMIQRAYEVTASCQTAQSAKMPVWGDVVRSAPYFAAIVVVYALQ